MENGIRYLGVTEIARKWGLSDRRVRLLCEQGKIEGAVKDGRSWTIPADMPKPADGRRLRGKRITPEYEALFARVDALKAELDRCRPLTQGELERLRSGFLVEYTYDTNAIEGNTLTLRETALVLEGVTIGEKPLRDHLEAIGHHDAFLFVERLVRDRAALSERTVKEIHSLVLMDKPDDKGIYRRIPVSILGAAQPPPQPCLVPAQMEALFRKLDDGRLHAIETAAVFHLEFEGIHPFIDGNGRTGRLLINLMLMRHGYPPINIKYADRKRYYDCFDAFHQDQSPAAMIFLIAGYLEKRLRYYLSLVRPKADPDI